MIIPFEYSSTLPKSKSSKCKKVLLLDKQKRNFCKTCNQFLNVKYTILKKMICKVNKKINYSLIVSIVLYILI